MIHVTTNPSKFYGAFSNYTTQNITNTASAYAMTFGTTDEARGVSIVSGSNIVVQNSGIYNIQWSGQFSNSSNTDQDVYIWMRKNGTDIVGSTGKVSILGSRGPSSPGDVLPSWNFVMTLVGNDYLNLMWGATSSSVSLITVASATSPTRPSTADLILTVTQV